MEEYSKDMTLEECVGCYGQTRGLAVYLSAQSIEHLNESSNNFESLEGFIYDILADYIDE